jgi:CheY-like chemotaxis protein
MGGDKIEVESQLEKGSTFSFNLPLNPCSEQQTEQLKAKMAKVAHDAPRLSGHILLVEDNEINQEVAQEQLRQMGFRVSLAENGKVAVENVKQQHFDLVLMDIQMPVMDGYQATQAIRQFNGDIPIIALTAAAMIEDKQKALKVGMNGHLSKPIHSEQLRALLAETLAASNAHGDTKNDQAWEDELRTINSIAVPVINVEQGLLQLGGNRVLYDKLLQKFATQLATDFVDLVNDLTQLAKSEPVSDRIWTHLQRQNHALKGVAGNLAMDALHQQSKQMDLLLKGHSAPSPQQVAEFAQSFLATQAKLAELAELTALAKSPHQPNVDSTLAVDGVKVSHVLKALHKLLPHIEQSEFVDEPALQAIFEQLPPQNHQAWSQVTQYLDDFDFEQAAHALRRLINALS